MIGATVSSVACFSRRVRNRIYSRDGHLNDVRPLLGSVLIAACDLVLVRPGQPRGGHQPPKHILKFYSTVASENRPVRSMALPQTAGSTPCLTQDLTSNKRFAPTADMRIMLDTCSGSQSLDEASPRSKPKAAAVSSMPNHSIALDIRDSWCREENLHAAIARPIPLQL